MNKKKVIILLSIVMLIAAYLYYDYLKNKIPQYHTLLLDNIEFNNRKFDLVMENSNDQTLFLKDGFKMEGVLSLWDPNNPPRNFFEDAFVYKTEKKDYFLIVSSWDSSPKYESNDSLSYDIHIYDGKRELNGPNQEVIWFGKWFPENYLDLGDSSYFSYNEKTKKGLIEELQKISREGKI